MTSTTTENVAAASGTFPIGGDLPVVRLGYGTMQLPGEGVWGDRHRPRVGPRRAASRRRARRSPSSTPPTPTAPRRPRTLLKEALHPYDDDLVIATKAGLTRQGPGVWTPLGNPAYLRQQCELSLRRIGLERIDLFQLHRIDPDVRLEDQVGELKKLQDEGKIRHIGLSEVSVEQIEGGPGDRADRQRAEPLQPWQPQRRRAAGLLRERGPAFIPWRPHRRPATGRHLAGVAQAHDATPRRSPSPGCCSRSPVMLPIPGTSSVDHLEANTAAAAIELSADEIAQLSAIGG